MSSLTEMNTALQRQIDQGHWYPAANASTNPARAGLFKTLVRAMKRHRTAKALKQLDSHLLDDIGIARGQIDAIADKASAQAMAGEGAPAMFRFASLGQLPASIVTSVTKAWRHQAAIVALQRLPNHTLSDIGIERGLIPQTVDAMLARGEATPASARTATTAKAAKANAPKPVEIAVHGHKVAA